MTQTSNHVLIIDDEIDDIDILENMLEDDFIVNTCQLSDQVIKSLEQSNPCLVILNPAMENLNTTAVIEKAKALNPKSHVIFLSNLITFDDSILAYEQGADDFIPKPFNPIELYHKIQSHIKEVAYHVQLIGKAELARSTAFSAMESNSEMGMILRYMEEITDCNNHTQLATRLTKTIMSFGVNAIIQIRGKYKTVNFGCNDDSFEALLLTKSIEKGKIIEGTHKIIINDQQISLLIKNTPPKNDPKYGRMKDNFVMMLGASDARVTMIDLLSQLDIERESGLKSISGTAKASMQKIHDTFTLYEKNIWKQIQEYREHTESVLMTLGLSETQEDALIDSMDQFVKRVMETDETKELIKSSFNKLLSDLDNLN